MQPIIDLHCDTVVEMQAGRDIVAGNPDGHIDLERLRKGGVTAQVFACFVSSEIPAEKAFGHAQSMIGLLHTFCEQHPAEFQLVRTSSDLQHVPGDERIKLLVAVENGHAIQDDLKNLSRLKDRQVAYMTLTHSKNLSWASSSGDLQEKSIGLNAFGKKVIAAMNELGMIIDVSHVHESTFWDVIKLSKKPVIASHSNARVYCDTPRNLSDDQIRAIADNGGLIGINFFPGFLDKAYAEGLKQYCGDLFAELDRIETAYMDDPAGKSQAMQTFSRELRQRMRNYKVPISRITDHIVHIAEIAGTGHIGFGSDFDGIPALPDGVEGSDIYQELINQLKGAGFSEEDVTKIAGGNFLRVVNDNFD
jgi:membrane dipeptidase